MGRKLGLSDDEISQLTHLSKSHFEYQEWVALDFVRNFALQGGNKPSTENLSDYSRLYTEKEQKTILKIARTTDFLNRLFNTFKRSNPDEACRIP